MRSGAPHPRRLRATLRASRRPAVSAATSALVWCGTSGIRQAPAREPAHLVSLERLEDDVAERRRALGRSPTNRELAGELAVRGRHRGQPEAAVGVRRRRDHRGGRLDAARTPELDARADDRTTVRFAEQLAEVLEARADAVVVDATQLVGGEGREPDAPD